MEREQCRIPSASANPAATSEGASKDEPRRQREAQIPLLNGQRGSRGFKRRPRKFTQEPQPCWSWGGASWPVVVWEEERLGGERGTRWDRQGDLG